MVMEQSVYHMNVKRVNQADHSLKNLVQMVADELTAREANKCKWNDDVDSQ